MGFFSNGTEGDCYIAKYCENCIHWVAPEGEENKGCPVWDVHMFFTGSIVKETRAVLDNLIPSSKDGLSNEQCKMFIQIKAEGQTEF